MLYLTGTKYSGHVHENERTPARSELLKSTRRAMKEINRNNYNEPTTARQQPASRKSSSEHFLKEASEDGENVDPPPCEKEPPSRNSQGLQQESRFNGHGDIVSVEPTSGKGSSGKLHVNCNGPPPARQLQKTISSGEVQTMRKMFRNDNRSGPSQVREELTKSSSGKRHVQQDTSQDDDADVDRLPIGKQVASKSGQPDVVSDTSQDDDDLDLLPIPNQGASKSHFSGQPNVVSGTMQDDDDLDLFPVSQQPSSKISEGAVFMSYL